MAQGDIIMFDYTVRAFMNGEAVISPDVNLIARLITNDLVATEEDNPPVLDNYTAVAAEEISISGGSLYLSSGVSTFKSSSIKWPGGPGRPNNIYQMLVYVNKEPFRPILFVDLTPDEGATPWDLTKASLEFVWSTGTVVLKSEVT